MAERKVARSAESGEFVSEEEAAAHPETTVVETLDDVEISQKNIIARVHALAQEALAGVDPTGMMSLAQQALTEIKRITS